MDNKLNMSLDDIIKKNKAGTTKKGPKRSGAATAGKKVSTASGRSTTGRGRGAGVSRRGKRGGSLGVRSGGGVSKRTSIGSSGGRNMDAKWKHDLYETSPARGRFTANRVWDSLK